MSDISFRVIEDAIVELIKTVPAFRTVETWAGQMEDEIDSLPKNLPAAFVAYAGSEFELVDGPVHCERAGFTVLVAAASLRFDGSERTAAGGAYELVETVIRTLTNEDFGYPELERLRPVAVTLIRAKRGSAIYAVNFTTAFDTLFNWKEE